MRTRPACLALCLALATPAMAEDVRVLSGEHADFSRIVLIFGQPVGWEEGRTNRGFSLRFDRTGLAFDLSRVFDLIPRDRIRSISFDDESNTLVMESDCACAMEVFLAGKNTIAIDIAATSEPDAQAEQPSAGQSAFPRLRKYGVSDLGFALGAGRAAEVAPDRSISASGDEVQPAPLDSRRDHAALEEALLRQLGRAASQGLVDVRLPDGPDTGAARTMDVSVLRPGTTHVAAETVFDRAMPESRPALPEQASGTCPDEALLDPALWRTEPAEKAIGAARREILDVRDVPDVEAVSHLVRTYLSLGFGAEARATLQEFPVEFPGLEHYRSIANLLEDREGAELGRLESLQGCKGAVAVWATLAASAPTQLTDIDAGEIQRWFFQFPPNLRRLLGARLVENLHAAGWAEAAVGVRNAMERSMDAASPELALLDATTGGTQARSEAAVAKLQDLKTTDAAIATAATHVLLEEAIRARRVDPEAVVLAEALATENGESEIGRDLLTSIAIAHAQLGNFDAALAFHERWAAGADIDDGVDRVLSGVVEEMVSLQDDAALLRVLNGGGDARDLQDLSTDVSHAVAERLLEIGLWEQAETLLVSQGRISTLRHRQLTAEAALQGNDAKLALAILAGEPDPGSVGIRARALGRLGDHAAASELLHRAGEAEGAAREAWLSGKADLVDLHGTELQQSFLAARGSAQAVATEGGEPRSQPVTLEHARDLIRNSGEMRSHIDSLISGG